ncbi:MAG: hypothetical protein PWQ82_968 [Thermosediminibacterales bacterium]|nr:hypothetical protein [Thermosediminibacterales bacterium]
MEHLTKQPIFWIGITILLYVSSSFISNKFKNPLCNPIPLSGGLIILLLLFLNVDYQTYMTGGKYIHLLLGPATVALALPLYRQRKLLKRFGIPIITGIAIGSTVGIISTYIFAKFLKTSDIIALSLTPKSVTTPIAMEVSKIIGGIPSLTASVVVFTGILGAVSGPEILKLFKIKNPISIGIAIGTSSHGLGTSRAIKEGEVEGSMSGLAIGVAGIFTAVLTPLFLKFL